MVHFGWGLYESLRCFSELVTIFILKLRDISGLSEVLGTFSPPLFAAENTPEKEVFHYIQGSILNCHQAVSQSG